MEEKKASTGHIDLLLRKLRVYFNNAKRRDLAKIVNIDHVKTILKANQIKTEDQIYGVKSITPSFTSESDEILFTIILK